MKYLVIFLLLTACKSHPTAAEREADHQRMEKIREADRKLEEKEEVEKAERDKRREKVKKIGTSLEAYKKEWGEPSSVDMEDNATILWYSGDEPHFATFKNGSLTAWRLDRETLKSRGDQSITCKEGWTFNSHTETCGPQVRD